MHHGVNPWHDRVNDEGRQAFVRQRSTDIKDRSGWHTAHILSLAGIVARAHFRMQAIYPPIIAAAYTFLPPASPDVGTDGKDGSGRRFRSGSEWRSEDKT